MKRIVLATALILGASGAMAEVDREPVTGVITCPAGTPLGQSFFFGNEDGEDIYGLANEAKCVAMLRPPRIAADRKSATAGELSGFYLEETLAVQPNGVPAKIGEEMTLPVDLVEIYVAIE